MRAELLDRQRRTRSRLRLAMRQSSGRGQQGAQKSPAKLMDESSHRA
jgi:hypothetical protein